VLEVRVDGALGDTEVLRDVAVGHALADQRRDLPFPAGQQAGRALAARRGRQFVGVRHRERDLIFQSWGSYPARAGGPWLCRTFVLSLFHAVVVRRVQDQGPAPPVDRNLVVENTAGHSPWCWSCRRAACA